MQNKDDLDNNRLGIIRFQKKIKKEVSRTWCLDIKPYQSG